MSFWDSSAIVPLCLNEVRSQSARMYWRGFPERYVWREAPIEIASAIARRLRERSISEHDVVFAETRLADLETRWRDIETTDRCRNLARTFPKLYGLRALDSLQLAAALVWCKELPNKKDFISADNRLCRAAESAGFTVHYLS